jgi:hypothetical protein
MGIELRLPQIQGSDREQLQQIRSYLYQLTEQLQWALSNIDTVGGTGSGVNAASGNLPNQQIGGITISNSVSAINPEITFAKIKDLIIKSADIVDAYYDEINKKLKGLYVAQSDFGTFIERTELDIEATSEYVDQTFGSVQALITDTVEGLKVTFGGLGNEIDGVTGEVENLKTSNEATNGKIGELNDAIGDINSTIADLKVAVIEANAYIRSGELYKIDNAIPVYGLEIGQRNTINGVEVFNKYARFTSDRLSFFDKNANEVAYISDRKLFIENAEITASLREGGFVDTITESGNVVTKWVGGKG